MELPQGRRIYNDEYTGSLYMSPECLNGNCALCEDPDCECECHDEEMNELLLEP